MKLFRYLGCLMGYHSLTSPVLTDERTEYGIPARRDEISKCSVCGILRITRCGRNFIFDSWRFPRCNSWVASARLAWIGAIRRPFE